MIVQFAPSHCLPFGPSLPLALSFHDLVVQVALVVPVLQAPQGGQASPHMSRAPVCPQPSFSLPSQPAIVCQPLLATASPPLEAPEPELQVEGAAR